MTKVQEGEACGTQQMGTVGRYRWAVDISHWNPGEEELEFLCSEILLEDEKKQCMRFKFLEDRKRAVVSKLLQRHAGNSIAWFVGSGVDGNGCDSYVEENNVISNCTSARNLRQVELGKTKGRKPFLASHELHPGSKGWDLVPNFNFSVSHEVGCMRLK
jgi:4'-phosphopantetheinyl transferase